MCCCNCTKAQTFTITVHTPAGLDEETIARIAAERAGSLWRD